MKSLVWLKNRHQKVFHRLVALCICAVGLEILKFEQTSLFYSVSYLNSGDLELGFGGAMPIKDPQWLLDSVAKLQLAF